MWCVVHVKDRGQQNAENFIASVLSKNLYARCFHLTRIRRKKYEGQWRTVYEDLLPGYIFIDTDQPDRVYKELKEHLAVMNMWLLWSNMNPILWKSLQIIMVLSECLS